MSVGFKAGSGLRWPWQNGATGRPVTRSPSSQSSPLPSWQPIRFKTKREHPAPQARNPLHGITLAAMLEALVDHYGWPALADRIALRCFAVEPSLTSSLKMLRKTPWAREKVESLYLFMLREQKRQSG